MNATAVALVLSAATFHAAWNLLAKRIRGGVEVTWAYAAVGTVVLTPLGLWSLRQAVPEASWLVVFAVMGVSAALHVAYMASLQKGYLAGDLSAIYPLARGGGPVVATLLAVAMLGERPPLTAWAGTGLVAMSAFLLVSGGSGRPSRKAILWGLATALCIGAYSVFDAFAVTTLAIAPLLFLWGTDALRTALLTPLAWARRQRLGVTLRQAPWAVVGVGLLSPAAYLLILQAYRLAPVSLVAPMREVSILITVALGAGLLGEGHWRRRALAGAGMAVGVTILALH